MNKKVGITVGIIIAFLLGVYGIKTFMPSSSASESYAEMVSISHKYGETEVPKNPERVIVLDNGTLDVMDYLGMDGIVGVSKSGLPDYLKAYNDDKYETVGSLKEIDLEKISELKPDLIIIEGRQESYYDELSKIAPTIGLGTSDNDIISSLENNIKILEAIFDSANGGEAKVKELKAEIEAINKEVQEEGAEASVILVSDSSMNVYGSSSRFGAIYNYFGFKLSDENLGESSNHGQTISYEYLLSQNPDYVFVVDKNAITGNASASAKEVVETDLIRGTDAYKNGKIIYLDAQSWYTGGAGFRSISTMIDDMKSAIS